MAVKFPVEKRDPGSQTVDLALVRALAAVLDETGLTEIEFGDGDRHIRVARAPAPVGAYLPPAAPVAVPAGTGGAAEAVHPGAVVSPMVGAAYLAPEPGAAPFVKPGDSVQEGDTLLIIEAMKTMNPIRAPRGGRIARILVENGAPVEYGETLLIIE
jgi:acetyl-CoA carboxylase biotin carboxyl carrier protein